LDHPALQRGIDLAARQGDDADAGPAPDLGAQALGHPHLHALEVGQRAQRLLGRHRLDRKSTRLNSSHVKISYAVFCLKKKPPLISPLPCWFLSSSCIDPAILVVGCRESSNKNLTDQLGLFP